MNIHSHINDIYAKIEQPEFLNAPKIEQEQYLLGSAVEIIRMEQELMTVYDLEDMDKKTFIRGSKECTTALEIVKKALKMLN